MHNSSNVTDNTSPGTGKRPQHTKKIMSITPAAARDKAVEISNDRVDNLANDLPGFTPSRQPGIHLPLVTTHDSLSKAIDFSNIDFYSQYDRDHLQKYKLIRMERNCK